VLFKHEAPATNSAKQRLLERPSVHTKPVLKENDSIEGVYLAVQLLVRVNLINSYIATTAFTLALDLRRYLSCFYYSQKLFMLPAVDNFYCRFIFVHVSTVLVIINGHNIP